jgi:hypothetical protein
MVVATAPEVARRTVQPWLCGDINLPHRETVRAATCTMLQTVCYGMRMCLGVSLCIDDAQASEAATFGLPRQTLLGVLRSVGLANLADHFQHHELVLLAR